MLIVLLSDLDDHGVVQRVCDVHLAPYHAAHGMEEPSMLMTAIAASNICKRLLICRHH